MCRGSIRNRRTNLVHRSKCGRLSAKAAGEAVEQAVSSLFEPEGVRGEALAGLKDFAATCDIASGQVTVAVVDMALDRLADGVKNIG